MCFFLYSIFLGGPLPGFWYLTFPSGQFFFRTFWKKKNTHPSIPEINRNTFFLPIHLQRVLVWCLCRPGQHSIGLEQVRLDGCLVTSRFVIICIPIVSACQKSKGPYCMLVLFIYFSSPSLLGFSWLFAVVDPFWFPCFLFHDPLAPVLRFSVTSLVCKRKRKKEMKIPSSFCCVDPLQPDHSVSSYCSTYPSLHILVSSHSIPNLKINLKNGFTTLVFTYTLDVFLISLYLLSIYLFISLCLYTMSVVIEEASHRRTPIDLVTLTVTYTEELTRTITVFPNIKPEQWTVALIDLQRPDRPVHRRLLWLRLNGTVNLPVGSKIQRLELGVTVVFHVTWRRRLKQRLLPSLPQLAIRPLQLQTTKDRHRIITRDQREFLNIQS